MELQWAVASYGRRFPLMEAGVVRRSIHGVYIHDQDSQRPLLIGKGEIRPQSRSWPAGQAARERMTCQRVRQSSISAEGKNGTTAS
jgi:hypothetical protein